MGWLAPIATVLGIEINGLVQRLKSATIAYSLMAVFTVLGFGFLLGAGSLALAAELGAINAALILGGAFLLLALITFLVMRIGEAARRRRRVEQQHDSDKTALLTTAALTALPTLLRSPFLRTVGLPAAALAGYLLLRRPPAAPLYRDLRAEPRPRSRAEVLSTPRRETFIRPRRPRP